MIVRAAAVVVHVRRDQVSGHGFDRVDEVAVLRLDARGLGDRVGAAELLGRAASAEGPWEARVGVGPQRVRRDRVRAVDDPGRALDPQDLCAVEGRRVHVAVERHVERRDGAVEHEVVGRGRRARDVGLDQWHFAG